MLFTVDNEAGKITCLCQVPQVRIPCSPAPVGVRSFSEGAQFLRLFAQPPSVFVQTPLEMALLSLKKKIDFKDRKGEGERKGGREGHQSSASRTCPNWELNPQPEYVPWPGIEPATFW